MINSSIVAAGGMGKSTAMKHLALSWADGSADELKRFDFIFHISLKNVHPVQPIENIIIEQHRGLSGNDVQPGEIKNIIEGNANNNVLVILDGHDEYKNGTNAYIDKTITKEHLRNCCVILTSRETKDLPAIREYIDIEAEITGFDPERAEEYVTKYLGSQEKCDELMHVARESKIMHFDHDSEELVNENFGILRIPILLHMICVLFLRRVSLPSTKTGILSTIVRRCPDWDEIRRTGRRTEKDIEDALCRLGKLALEKLLRGDQSFDKVQKPFCSDLFLNQRKISPFTQALQ